MCQSACVSVYVCMWCVSLRARCEKRRVRGRGKRTAKLTPRSITTSLPSIRRTRHERSDLVGTKRSPAVYEPRRSISWENAAALNPRVNTLCSNTIVEWVCQIIPSGNEQAATLLITGVPAPRRLVIPDLVNHRNHKYLKALIIKERTCTAVDKNNDSFFRMFYEMASDVKSVLV